MHTILISSHTHTTYARTQILMHNEMFNGIKCFSYLDIDRDPAWGWDIFSRDRDPQGFVADLMRYRPPPGSTDARLKSAEPRAVGFKLFPEHWTPSAHSTLQRLVADPNVKKVRAAMSRCRLDSLPLAWLRSSGILVLSGGQVHQCP